MKNLFKNGNCKTLLIFLLLSFIQTISFGQDSTSKSVTTTTKTTSTTWYAQPWVWVVGGVVLLIILVALLRGNSSGTDRTTIIKD